MEATLQELEFLDHGKFHEKWEEKKAGKKNYCVLVYELYDEVLMLTPAEFGRLAMGQLYYSVTGEVPQLPGNERYLFGRVKTLEDQFQKYFAEEGRKRSARAKKASDAAKEKRMETLRHLETSQGTSRSQEDPCDIHNTNYNSNSNDNSNSNSKTNSNSKSNLSTPPRDGVDTGAHTGPERDEGERKRLYEEKVYLSDQKDRIGKDTPREEEEGALARAMARVEACCGTPMGKRARDELSAFLRAMGEETITHAVELAIEYGSRNWGYIRKILQSWEQNGPPATERAGMVNRPYHSSGNGTGNYGMAYHSRNDPNMYCRHHRTTLSELEREAIRAALEEE